MGNIDNIFRIVYEPPFSTIVYQCINKCRYDNYYPISCGFCIKNDYFALKCLIWDILSLAPL